MNRRDLLRTGGLTVLGVITTGCLNTDAGEDGTGAENGTGDTLADTQGRIVEEYHHENLRITESSLYRSSDGFGVHGTVKNVGDRPMTMVEVHVRLVDPGNEVIGEFYDDHADEQEVWRLEPGEAENFDVDFPRTEPSEVEEAVRYEIWAEGEVE